ncbi:hypothetical protein WICPIJ_004078 [Wickerhamomyces pijperi]|uniref:L-type lectin-like domain-containing protein n=1 Tax=Wickerhamomyces pijperi TaxID=599730 RepID=A0A9P8TN41_WICPI|nr:hypothetical protein WICPIJ_004078 [Wickerhamomyces pijperi]
MSSFAQKLKTNKGYQTGALITLLFTFYTLINFIFGGSSSSSETVGSGNDEYNLNELLSGSSSQSDIVKAPLHEQDLIAPFLQNKYENHNWEFLGDTLINKNQYVRLTTEKPNQSGLIQSRKPLSGDVKGFQLDFEFAIHGSAKSNGFKGDGFALFITEDKLEQGPVFGAQDYFKGLGLFFDTYRNAKKGRVFPIVSLMRGDGKTPYDKDNDGKANEIAGCSARGLYNPRNGKTTARLIYTADDGYLSFDYQIKDGEWKNCFSITDFQMPKDDRYIAFGAATGELSENVDILSFEAFKLLHNDQEITSFDSYIVQEEAENFELEYTVDNRGRRKIPTGKARVEKIRERREKLRAKLKYKQQLKNREMERQGYHISDDSNWVFFKLIWAILKYVLMSLVVFSTIWVAYTVYRVKSKKQRKVGLLD